MIGPIEEFRFNGNALRIAWLGRINYSSEPLISVYLSEIDLSHPRILSNEALTKPETHRVANVRIGLLPLLKLGSIWIDGVMQPPLSPLKEIDLVLQHGQTKLVRFDGSIEIDGAMTPILPSWRYRIGKTASEEAAGSWLVVAHDPTPELRFVAIPSSVMFQTCVATSPKAIRHLVFGQLGSIADLDQSGFFAQEPNTYRITLFKDFRDAEAPALANLLADPVGRNAYLEFRNTLVSQSAGFDRSRTSDFPETHIKLNLPFSNPANMKVRGKFLPLHRQSSEGQPQQWGFLVTEIVDFQVRLAFDHLVIDRKNDSRQGANAGDPNLPFAFRPVAKGPAAPTEPLQPITSAQDPVAFLEKLSLESSGGLRPIGLKRIFEPKAVQRYRAWPIVPSSKVEFDGSGATGDPHWGIQGAAELDLISEPPPQFPVSLEHFLDALDILDANGFPFKTLVVSNMHRQIRQHSVNYLPRRIEGVRSWHLVTEGLHSASRGYVVAELKRGGTWHYLVELERKGNEALALAHIRHHAGTQIDRQYLQYFMVDVAKENGWNAIDSYRNWVYQPIRHTPSRGVHAFAQAVMAKL